MTAAPVQAVPEGYHSVTPWIISRDTAQLIDFVTAAFGAQELGRFQMEDGTIGHAEVRVGDSVVMMFDRKQDWPDTPAFLRLFVEDGDAVFQQAVHAGATPLTEMTHLYWGDRVGRVRDPLGNLWWIQTRVEDVDAEEAQRRLGEQRWIDAMEYVQGAQFFPSAS
jgi:uncharacterized glyoxalase superfamily protein PhnB